MPAVWRSKDKVFIGIYGTLPRRIFKVSMEPFPIHKKVKTTIFGSPNNLLVITLLKLKIAKGGFHSDAIEEPVLVPQRTPKVNSS